MILLVLKNIQKLLFALLVIGCLIDGFGQVELSVNDCRLHITNSAYLVIRGDIVNNSALNSDNDGKILVSQDWKNNDPSLFLSAKGKGEVILDGGLQHIEGNPTRFYDLTLEGGNSTKELLCDAETHGTLNLKDANLETIKNIHYHKNPDNNSIIWNDGYVSSKNLGGYLYREMDSQNDYMFPVGSSALNLTFRPVSVIPSSSSASGFFVRCAGLSPDSDTGTSVTKATAPFLTTQKEDKIESIYTGFYHNIYQNKGDKDAEVAIHYHSNDGEFASIAQWKKSNQWQDLEYPTENWSTTQFAATFDKKITFAISEKTHDAFALITTQEFTNIFIPNAFTPNENSLNDFFEPVLTALSGNEEFKFMIFDRWGNLIYEADDPERVQWDGNYKGSPVQEGVYVWKLSGKFKNDKKFMQDSGTLTVLR